MVVLLLLDYVSIQVGLPVALQNITIHKKTRRQEDPSKSLLGARVNRVIIALTCPFLVSLMDRAYLIVISSSHYRVRFS